MINPALITAAIALATGVDTGGGWLSHIGVTGLVALAPFVVIVSTSFAKVALVLNIMRSALGAPGVPPASVITALAVVVSIFVMAPVATEMADSVELAVATQAADQDADPYGMNEARRLYAAASPPLLGFLELNAPQSEIDFFSQRAGEPPGTEPGIRVLLPAFALTEIIEAFFIGVLIFIPFLVIDLIVGFTLQALGMHMTQPATVSLPLKLLLFVAVDGWHVIVDGLIVSYGM